MPSITSVGKAAHNALNKDLHKSGSSLGDSPKDHRAEDHPHGEDAGSSMGMFS